MMHPTMSVETKTSVPSILAMAALALTIGTQAGLAQHTPPAETVQNGQQQMQVIFSPWARYCTRGLTEQSSEIRGKEVCFTAADGHLKSGQKLVIALLIEPEGGTTKLLRVTLPLGVALIPGARIVIDEKEAMTAPYVACLPKNGCMADYKADADLIEKLKKGGSLAIQAFDKGKPISFTLPLTGFAKAYEGPAGDPAGLNELREGLPSQLQSHADDHRDKPDGR
jgi:invasion protein IalB